EHASSAPLMRVLYWKFIAASSATVDFVIFRQYVFFIRKRLPTGHFILYLTQIDIKNEIFLFNYLLV
ncbi:MAG: hypothetical protein ACYT04_78040, partial [Nostoc sp.]